MALQTGVIKFTGRLDNVIGYRRNGKYFLRSMPDKVRQTAATKRAARRFGIASRKGKLIRKAFCPYLEVRYDGSLVNRLNKLFIQAGRDRFPDLQGFHFNRHTGTEKLFVLPPVFTINGTLHIPAQELLEQGNATHVEIRLIATRINFTEQRIISTDASTAVINLEEPFNGMALSVPIEGEGALLVALQYRSFTIFNGKPSFSRDRRFMAADIISVTVPAEKGIYNKDTYKDTHQGPAYRKSLKRLALISSLTSSSLRSSSPSLRGPQGPRARPGRSNLPPLPLSCKRE